MLHIFCQNIMIRISFYTVGKTYGTLLGGDLLNVFSKKYYFYVVSFCIFYILDNLNIYENIFKSFSYNLSLSR